MMVEDLVPIYTQIIAKFVAAANAKDVISSWLAPHPNTPCKVAATTSLIDMSGISTGIFTSIEKERYLIKAFKNESIKKRNIEKEILLTNQRIKIIKKLVLV